jgi:phosphomannomutase
VKDAQAKIAAIKEIYGGKKEVTLDELDGLTVNGDTWWFNVRASNTEPLLRLNVEAKTQARMEKLRDQVLGEIRA